MGKISVVLVFFFGLLHFQGKVPVQGTCLSLLVMAILSPVLYLFPHFKFSCWRAQGKHLVCLSPCSDQQTGHFLLHVRSYLEGIFKLKRRHWTIFPSVVVEIPTVIFYQPSGTRALLQDSWFNMLEVSEHLKSRLWIVILYVTCPVWLSPVQETLPFFLHILCTFSHCSCKFS